MQGSNSIEGYDASINDVLNVMEDEPPLDAMAETVAALQGYRDAMTYVLQLADETDLLVDLSLIKSLHFMMLKHDLATLTQRLCVSTNAAVAVNRRRERWHSANIARP